MQRAIRGRNPYTKAWRTSVYRARTHTYTCRMPIRDVIVSSRRDACILI